jgi:hypothetical protein
MKHSIISFLFGLTIVLLISCDEEPPYINFEPTRVTYETTYVETNVPPAELRTVLLEDISGVRCVNCPDAAAIIENIKTTNPGRVNSITIHPNTASLDVFTRPIVKPGHESRQDFRTTEGGQLLSKLGIPGSLPSGYINRKMFPGKVNRFLERTEWASFVDREKDSVTPVNLNVKGSLDGDKAIADVELTFTQALAGEYYMTVMLLEDSIVDTQEYQDGVSILYDNNYVHRHVLRGIFTGFAGDRLDGTLIGGTTATLDRGRVIKKRFSLDTKPVWRKDKLEIMLLVHRGSDEVVVHCKKYSFGK